MLRRLVLLCCALAMLIPLASLHAQSPRVLRVMWMKSGSDAQELLDLVEQFAAEFEAQNAGTDVQVEFVDWSDGRQTILDRMNAGNPPDLAVIGARWVPEFVSLGYIEPLDRYIEPGFRSRFIPGIINEGAVYQGQTFGLPVNTATRALFYNRAIFAQAGLDAAPQSWDDLLAAGTAIGAAGFDGFGLQGGGGLETNTYFYYFVWGNGGNLYNEGNTESAINSPEAVEALAFLQTMIADGATQDTPASPDYDRRAKLEDAFMQGTLGMVISGPWFINRLRSNAPEIDFGVAPLPHNTTPATYGVIDTLVMMSTATDKSLAWQYLEFLYDEERRLAYHRIGGFLPELSLLAPELAADDADFAVFLDLLPQARFEPLHIHSEDIAQIVIDAVRAVYLGEAEPQDALDAAAYAIGELLNTTTAGW